MQSWQAPQRLQKFPEYVFARLEREKKLVEQAIGRTVFDLSIGSPDIPPSESYTEKLSEFVKDEKAHLYPGYSGTDEFKDAVIGWYKKRFNVVLERSEILPLLGAKDGVAHLPLALLDEEDEFLLPDPGYPGFAGPALAIGAKPVAYSLSASNDCKPIIDELRHLITKRTKYIWVNFPSNPTGATASVGELVPIVSLARSTGVAVVYDNAYSEITFDGYLAPSILQIDGAKDIAVELGSFSKTFSFAGYRMGWIVGNKTIIAALAKVKSQFDSGMPLPLQRLGAYALLHQDMDWHKKMIATYKSRRDAIAAKISQLGLTFSVPSGSLYFWAKIPDSAANSEDYCMDMLRTKQVLFAPGSAFGLNGERYVRVSICADISNLNEYL